MTDLRQAYPWLWNFLAGRFADRYDAAQSDASIVAEFLAVDDEREHALVRDELAELLAARELPWRDVSNVANRVFADESTCRNWLLEIARYLDPPSRIEP
jgi:hypothetical protein